MTDDDVYERDNEVCDSYLVVERERELLTLDATLYAMYGEAGTLARCKT